MIIAKPKPSKPSKPGVAHQGGDPGGALAPLVRRCQGHRIPAEGRITGLCAMVMLRGHAP